MYELKIYNFKEITSNFMFIPLDYYLFVKTYRFKLFSQTKADMFNGQVLPYNFIYIIIQ